jgi:hypothetical protein
MFINDMLISRWLHEQLPIVGMSYDKESHFSVGLL